MDMDCDSGELIPGLPDDVAVQCIARVAMASHRSICLVCRRWRALIRCSLFASTRLALNCREPLLLFKLIKFPDLQRLTTSRWFALISLHPLSLTRLSSPPREDHNLKDLSLIRKGPSALVDGVIYCCPNLTRIKGYVPQNNAWKDLRGLDARLPSFLPAASMANFAGNLVVLWLQSLRGKTSVMYAEIKVSHPQDGQLWGSILQSGALLCTNYPWECIRCIVMEF